MNSFQIPEYILSDLCTRFIINIPGVEGKDVIRVFFQIELAHWFYLDFYCTDNPDLKTCSIKEFAAQVFRFCPTFSKYDGNFEAILEKWKEYKSAVPTYGAIMLDTSLQYCLLVQGYWVKASWSFPKGKVNQDENPVECAIREVMEETGYDIRKLLIPNNYLENRVGDQVSRLYIIPGVSMETAFHAKTRQEIKGFSWFNINYLPSHKKDGLLCKQHYNLNPNAFFMVIPFIKDLHHRINQIKSNLRTPNSSLQYSNFSPVIKHRSPDYSISTKQKSVNCRNLSQELAYINSIHETDFNMWGTKNQKNILENQKKIQYNQQWNISPRYQPGNLSSNATVDMVCPLWTNFHLDLSQYLSSIQLNIIQ